ncbi:hypothetical protein SMJ63A_60232 [Stenotrophomonas geniculata]
MLIRTRAAPLRTDPPSSTATLDTRPPEGATTVAKPKSGTSCPDTRDLLLYSPNHPMEMMPIAAASEISISTQSFRGCETDIVPSHESRLASIASLRKSALMTSPPPQI